MALECENSAVHRLLGARARYLPAKLAARSNSGERSGEIKALVTWRPLAHSQGERRRPSECSLAPLPLVAQLPPVNGAALCHTCDLRGPGLTDATQTCL
ncbi:hypothetical protein J6590_010559 [Homalodisca vitripennis]|nr:hypothetical protein J6590_010559 [Homalodisca vitripennis]